VSEPLERAREIFARFEDELRSNLPENVEIFDAHTHLGHDIDGMVGSYDELISMMDRYGISRAFTFCLDEPDRHPAFRAANDRTLAYAAQSEGRLIPFVRLDLTEEPIADLAGLSGRFARYPGVFFDTSVWSPIDLLELYRLVPPEQIVYASDYPYGAQPNSLLIALRTARAAGLAEEQIREILHGNANRIANGEPPIEPSQPEGSEMFQQPLAFARIHQYLSMALPMLFLRQQDSFGALGLALNATYEPNGHVQELAEIRELLETARDVWRELPEAPDEAETRRVARTTSRLVHLADILAVTTAA
jgi:hypothetical protein